MEEIKQLIEFKKELSKKCYGYPGNLHIDWVDVEKVFIDMVENSQRIKRDELVKK